jgi:hypothetical protein
MFLFLHIEKVIAEANDLALNLTKEYTKQTEINTLK